MLVQRLDDVAGRTVLVDGQPVTAVTQDSLRAAIAVVPQEISLFHRSILENIRYSRPDATDEEVFAAARAAYCDGFIRELPAGYDTLVGERGIKLSGGQRQRLGLARAILKDAPILLLRRGDLGARIPSPEILVQRALARLMRGRTVLAIAHRLSTLSAMDRIVVLDQGRIVEDGSPPTCAAAAACSRRSGGCRPTASRWTYPPPTRREADLRRRPLIGPAPHATYRSKGAARPPRRRPSEDLMTANSPVAAPPAPLDHAAVRRSSSASCCRRCSWRRSTRRSSRPRCRPSGASSATSSTCPGW